ncbi:Putative Autophagy protein 5 [Aspergillus calidoustus]|uniref:Autophagy protein 5 n=1 Tax=Aspergillus calidoustus TaxID=454130 RepID=A0A0U5GRR1_ASPCI|nr:Putative Autophagy protein 5 [Aspergillus calidoustus]
MDQLPLGSIQKAVWDGNLPLQITLAPSESRTYDQTDPYLISYPRISYLPSLLPRLKAFFSSSLIDPASSASHDGWFSFENVPLKWHYPVGLLYDLYAGAAPATKSSDVDYSSASDDSLPWKLVVHFSDWPDEELVRLDAQGMVMNDAFINSVKEADFVRNGTAKGIMSLSKDDSSGLWKAVQDVDLPSFQRIMNILLPPPAQPFRNLPIRLFLPLPPKPDSTDSNTDPTTPSLKVVQSPIPPTITLPLTQTTTNMTQSTLLSSSRLPSGTGSPQPQTQQQTIGSALHSLLPNLFPSKRTPVLAKPVLHGAAVPMSAPVEEVVRCSAYGDGWVYIVIRMMG